MKMTFFRTAPREAFKKVQLLPELPSLAAVEVGTARTRLDTPDRFATSFIPGRYTNLSPTLPAFPVILGASQL